MSALSHGVVQQFRETLHSIGAHLRSIKDVPAGYLMTYTRGGAFTGTMVIPSDMSLFPETAQRLIGNNCVPRRNARVLGL